MGLPVLLYGKSGSGKSRSLKFFGEDEILLVNIEGKALPFKKTFKYICRTDSLDTIITQLQKMPCKTAVIDDAGYLVQKIKKEVPDDVIVYIILHEDTNDIGETKIRTIGKLIDNKVCLEGMVTICIRCMSDNGKHFFRTQTDGFDITKTPEDMFEETEIDNNLKAVDDTIRAFYGWNEGK